MLPPESVLRDHLLEELSVHLPLTIGKSPKAFRALGS
jgi:hypothetical protein